MADTNASCDDPRAAMSSRELVGDAACVRLWSLLVAAAVARHRDTVFSNTGARVFADQIRRVGCVARHWT